MLLHLGSGRYLVGEPTSTSGGFKVDTAQVKAFGDTLRSDALAKIQPEGTEAGRIFATGACFGERTGSPEVFAAKKNYVDRMNAMLRLMDAFVHNAETISQTITTAMETYKGSDSMSAIDFNDLLAKTSTAVANADAARKQADDAAYQEDIRLRNARGADRT
jgi:hypothetical protein